MKKIILDCDPGHDDALAMMLALASQDIELLAITTSAGNQTPQKTLKNAMRLLTLMKQQNIPVAGGNQKPLLNELIIADTVHGESGLDGAVLPEPDFKAQAMTAIELIAKTLQESKDLITLVVTGPMTNAALFLAVYPELKTKIEQIVFMGGAMGLGNWAPSVEFNIFVDPHAAKMVLGSGIPIVMVPLNVTHKAQILKSEIAKIHEIGNPVADVFAGLLDFFERYHEDPKWRFKGVPLHDPCTIAWLIDPTIFQEKFLNVAVEVDGALTQGETVVDYYDLSHRQKNCKVLLDIDRDAFIKMLMDALKTFHSQ
ncbi:pyrimidine-specific ribonucleoside hydrolase RihA [Propionispira raffinosivorans]|uniref:pyrimidine-specific ribonucleoside hydrolase RihA n=1 Tax=Propionispira raffinosivorans TaxID=86959 RepID=UPI0003663DCC|nr:pyrimidine-specific ribonucleoside hydrolase RihA [Propionispira raffinosivorans]